MLEKVCDPFRILYIRLAAGDSLHMAGIDHHGLQAGRFKDIEQGLPIRRGALHGSHFTAAIPEPVSQFKKLPSRCTKVTYFLFPATSETGNDKLFVHINTTTFVVNLIHTCTSKVKFTARYSVSYHFTIRPFAGA